MLVVDDSSDGKGGGRCLLCEARRHAGAEVGDVACGEKNNAP